VGRHGSDDAWLEPPSGAWPPPSPDQAWLHPPAGGGWPPPDDTWLEPPSGAWPPPPPEETWLEPPSGATWPPPSPEQGWLEPPSGASWPPPPPGEEPPDDGYAWFGGHRPGQPAGGPPGPGQPGYPPAPRHPAHGGQASQRPPADSESAGLDGNIAAANDPAVRRRTTIILRYLLGRLAVDHIRRLTRWFWVLIPVGGLLALLLSPRWIGVGVAALGVLMLVLRVAAVRMLHQRSLAPEFRSAEDELAAAVDAGRTSLRVELRRVGLPSRSWHLPVFALRLARGKVRAKARARLRAVDVDRVLPRAQLQRALRLLEDARSAPH
jgi:hypothetical protein